MNKKQGFTLIEMIIVIVILGVLVVLAMPKFVGFAEDAHDARVSVAADELKEGIENFHLKWQASVGQAGTILSGTGLYSSASGYPAGSTGAFPTVNQDCMDIFNAMFVNSPSGVVIDSDFGIIASTDNVDWAIDMRFAGSTNGIGGTNGPNNYCTFSYLPKGHASGAVIKRIVYVPRTGEVAVVNVTLP